MIRIPMLRAAAALLRALVARAEVERNRILLSDASSIGWRSLTFTGERHVLRLRVPGPDSRFVVDRMCDGIEDAEFSVPGVIVAHNGLAGAPHNPFDGSTSVTIQALTVAEA
jgi:hypothetical protein